MCRVSRSAADAVEAGQGGLEQGLTSGMTCGCLGSRPEGIDWKEGRHDGVRAGDLLREQHDVQRARLLLPHPARAMQCCVGRYVRQGQVKASALDTLVLNRRAVMCASDCTLV